VNALRRLIPNKIRDQLRNRLGKYLCGRLSYSQEGEDLVLHRLFDTQSTGFYVDVGCHHPYRFSNTYSFYRAGWTGLCIDPLPGVKALFAKYRSRDIVIEMGVAAIASELKYHRFNEPALNTFDERLARERDGKQGYRLVGIDVVPCDSLAAILERNLGSSQTAIDFMSVDAEGFDLQVLESNDWTRYHPKAIVAECLGVSLEKVPSDPLTTYLANYGYRPCAKLVNSVIFVRASLLSDRLSGCE
jgi:FkbM family methyltransferase